MPLPADHAHDAGGLPDGSCLPEVGDLQVRIIEADLAVTGADGTRTGDSCRLTAALADWRR